MSTTNDISSERRDITETLADGQRWICINHRFLHLKRFLAVIPLNLALQNVKLDVILRAVKRNARYRRRVGQFLSQTVTR